MKNLKKLRIAKELSLWQVSQYLHVGISTVLRWELGETNPTLCQLLKLCCILECTPVQLCSDFSKDEIVVFDTLNKCVYSHSLTDEMIASGCCFGLVLPYDVSDRFKKSDVCFFSADSAADTGSLVICCHDNYNESLHVFKAPENNLQIIASCHVLHTML